MLVLAIKQTSRTFTPIYKHKEHNLKRINKNMERRLWKQAFAAKVANDILHDGVFKLCHKNISPFLDTVETGINVSSFATLD